MPLLEAAGLVLAADVHARRSLPGFDNSAMDGFALQAADTSGATAGAPARLRLTGEVAAGAVAGQAVVPGTAVRIMTGAPVPDGADAVAEVEVARVDGDFVSVEMAVEAGRSVRRAGADVSAGELALAAGTVLGPGQMALLAALGETAPVCVPPPRVALTGAGSVRMAVEAALLECGVLLCEPREAELVVSCGEAPGDAPAIHLPPDVRAARQAFRVEVVPRLEILAGHLLAGW